MADRPWDRRPRGCARSAIAFALITAALALSLLGEALDWVHRTYWAARARYG